VLVVVRLHRLARSVGHLLHVIKDFEKRGVHLRPIRDQIDTSASFRYSGSWSSFEGGIDLA
jgi:DNA invertase Pin-like site-specific DNA recombinase